MKRLAVCLCAAATLLAAPALAETVKIVVPFAAGGPVDQMARVLAHALGPLLGADVIVDDMGGAGGAIGSETVARAAPDGRTMLLASLGSQVISPTLHPPGGYDEHRRRAAQFSRRLESRACAVSGRRSGAERSNGRSN